MFYNPFEGFRDPNDPYGLLRRINSPITPTPVQTTRFGPDGQPLPPDAPPATPGPTVAEGASPLTPFPPSPMAPMRTDVTSKLGPDDRADPRLTPTSSKAAEVVTPIVGPTGDPKTPDERRVPTLASTTPPPGTWDKQFAKLVEDKDFSGAVKALSAAFPKAPKAPPVFHVSDTRASQGVKDLSGSGQALLASIMKGRKADALIGGELGPRQKQPRQDDPHKYEQERFDFRRRKGR